MPPNTKSSFSGSAIDSYGAGLLRQVPGYSSLHGMVSLLLAEHVPEDGRVLVLGAGGGQEIRALAQAHPGWSFAGVDPSSDMLRLAEQVIGPQGARVYLQEGYIGEAPKGPFDAATSILIFHFIPYEQRFETLRQIRLRLKVGTPFVLVHLSFPQTEPERSAWIARHVAYGASNGADPAHTENAREAIRTRLTILSPEEDVAMLHRAGFKDVGLFYAGLSIKGWVAYAA